MYSNLQLVTAPAVEPVSTSEAKTHLRIDTSDEDTYIGTLIVVARQAVEAYANRALCTQTWKAFYSRWPSKTSYCDAPDGYSEVPYWYYDRQRQSKVILPKPPCQSITHIKTYDDADTATTYASGNYYSRLPSGDRAQCAEIFIRDTAAPPTPTRVTDGVEVQFVAGYGVASAVPAALKQAVLCEIAFRYNNRGDCGCDGDLWSPEAKGLAQPYRIMTL